MDKKDLEGRLKEFKEGNFLKHLRIPSDKDLKRIRKRVDYCIIHGHKLDKNEYTHSTNGIGPKVHGFCRRCYLPYERSLTSEELKSYIQKIQAPFTI